MRVHRVAAFLGYDASDAALLVLGTRGSGRLSSFLLGSTTRNILHVSAVPVHIVR